MFAEKALLSPFISVSSALILRLHCPQTQAYDSASRFSSYIPYTSSGKDGESRDRGEGQKAGRLLLSDGEMRE